MNDVPGAELRSDKKGWYITRNIPVALIAAITLQLVVAGWVASKYDSRITEQEAKLVAVKLQADNLTLTTTALAMKLSSMDGKLEFIVQSIKDQRK